jgi:hypothetical protein
MPCDKKKMKNKGVAIIVVKPDTTATKAKAVGSKQKGKKK